MRDVTMYTLAHLMFRYRQCLLGSERYGMRVTRVKCGGERWGCREWGGGESVPGALQ
jgi:hypothetical protein